MVELTLWMHRMFRNNS